MPKVAPTRSADPDAMLFALSEQAVVDPLPLDEKYRVRGGYSDWERAFGVDWNSQDERVG